MPGRAALWQRFVLLAPDGHAHCTPDPTLDSAGNHRFDCGAFAALRTIRYDGMAGELFNFAQRG